MPVSDSTAAAPVVGTDLLISYYHSQNSNIYIAALSVFLLIEASLLFFLHISDLALWASVTRWFLKELACLEALV